MTTEIIIGLVGLAIALASYNQSKKPSLVKFAEPEVEIENLKIHFIMNQKLSLEIQSILENHIKENNASDKLMFENMSFSKYLDFVKNDYENCLSDKVYKTLSEPIYTKPIVDSMLLSLQNQNTNLIMVKNMLSTM